MILAFITSIAYSLEVNGFAETLPNVKDRKVFWNNESGEISIPDKKLEFIAFNADNEGRLKQKGTVFDDKGYIVILSGGGNRTGVKIGGSLIIVGNLEIAKISDAKGKPIKPDKTIGKFNIYFYENNKSIIDPFIEFNSK